VGKTRIALGVAANVAPAYRDGVAVVELGDISAEVPGTPPPTATVLHRARKLINTGNSSINADPASPDCYPDADLLLILDNAEHLPSAVAAATKELLSSYPRVQVLITTRRPLTERLGVSREIRPLAVEPSSDGDSAYPPAVELVLRRAMSGSPAAVDPAHDIQGIMELCRRLGGSPRALEFAAQRLRTIPVRTLLAAGPALGMLRTNDHSLLPHQRSLATSIRWSIGLLTEEHRWLLGRIARLPIVEFSLDRVLDTAASVDRDAGSVLALFSDLVDNSLVTAGRDRLYEYRLSPYVREVVCADAKLQPESR
jgi:predicted ATPase